MDLHVKLSRDGCLAQADSFVLEIEPPSMSVPSVQESVIGITGEKGRQPVADPHDALQEITGMQPLEECFTTEQQQQQRMDKRTTQAANAPRQHSFFSRASAPDASEASSCEPQPRPLPPRLSASVPRQQGWGSAAKLTPANLAFQHHAAQRKTPYQQGAASVAKQTCEDLALADRAVERKTPTQKGQDSAAKQISADMANYDVADKTPGPLIAALPAACLPEWSRDAPCRVHVGRGHGTAPALQEGHSRPTSK